MIVSSVSLAVVAVRRPALARTVAQTLTLPAAQPAVVVLAAPSRPAIEAPSVLPGVVLADVAAPADKAQELVAARL